MSMREGVWASRVSGGNWRTLIWSIYKYIYYTKNNIWNRDASKKGDGLKKCRSLTVIN